MHDDHQVTRMLRILDEAPWGDLTLESEAWK